MRVPLFEVDIGQAVYHSNYYHFFELGRSELLKKIGYPYMELMNRQFHLTIVESRCRYRKPLKYDDEIEIHTGIASLNRRGLIFSQLIYKPARGLRACRMEPESELGTEAMLNMLCVNFAGRVSNLPEDFVLAVKKFIDGSVQL
jgi:acyl-CoA thioester hydrolase